MFPDGRPRPVILSALRSPPTINSNAMPTTDRPIPHHTPCTFSALSTKLQGNAKPLQVAFRVCLMSECCYAGEWIVGYVSFAPALPSSFPVHWNFQVMQSVHRHLSNPTRHRMIEHALMIWMLLGSLKYELGFVDSLIHLVVTFRRH